MLFSKWFQKSVTITTTTRNVAQPGSALAWGARGREFESRHSDQFEKACDNNHGPFSLSVAQADPGFESGQSEPDTGRWL